MAQNKMKILQLLCFPLYGSGSGTYARKLSEALSKRGHEIGVVTPDNRQVKNVKIFETTLPFMVAFTGHPEYPDAKLYSQLTGAQLNDVQSAFQEKVIKAVEEFKPDVIHVHHASNLAWIANYIKAVYQIHYIVTSHNTDVINAVLDKRYIPLTQDALRRADVITAVSKNTRERLLNIIGKGQKLSKKTKVVPCGVDVSLFPSEGTTKNVDRKYKLTGRKVALYSGKITAIKGVDLFIKAAKKFPEAIFIVMGDGEEKKAMEALALNEKITNVIFTGYLGSKEKNLISELYRRADVVVLPSTLSEGIPLSALEGLSAGTPVVATNLGGTPTAIKHMKNGILIRPKSVTAIIEGVEKIFSDHKLATRLGRQGRKDAVEKFNWMVIAAKMEKYYKVCHLRSQKNRATKKPSYISEEEYLQDKETVLQFKKEK